MNLEKIYGCVLQGGIRTYKFKNSRLRPPGSPNEAMKGSIFAYRSKNHMVAARGVVLTSIEGLLENEGNFTHWTPNVYAYGAYVDAARTITSGHSEDNLKQINCFYVDFDVAGDTDAITTSDILLTSLDLGFMPTCILATDKGYQAYFVLKAPIYLTKHSDFQSLKVAKAISQNLRDYFDKAGLPVDMTCNHFGIARIPRKDNLAYLELENTYEASDWIAWSMRQSELFVKRPNLTVLSGSQGSRQIDEPWYGLLLGRADIQGDKALLGRNNVLFTLALAHFSSGSREDVARMALTAFNDQLKSPVKDKELTKIIQSAYSGLYEAASRDYITLLCKAWVSDDLRPRDLFIRQAWHKFKKPREQRTNSHFSEWKEDLLAYLEKETDVSSVYLETTKKAIREALGIPERSLDTVLKELRMDHQVLFRVKSGRYGGIWIASIRRVFLAAIGEAKERRQAFIAYLVDFFKESRESVLEALSWAQRELARPRQLTLFERDIG